MRMPPRLNPTRGIRPFIRTGSAAAHRFSAKPRDFLAVDSRAKVKVLALTEHVITS